MVIKVDDKITKSYLFIFLGIIINCKHCYGKLNVDFTNNLDTLHLNDQCKNSTMQKSLNPVYYYIAVFIVRTYTFYI